MQRQLFLPRHGFHTVFNPIAAHLLFIEPQELPQSGEDFWQEGLEQRQHPDLVPVCTSEILAGNITGATLNSKKQAQHLKEFFPEARVLFMVRDQRKLLASVYKSLIAWGGSPTIRQLLATGAENEWVTYLRYHTQARHYRDLFGAERLLVLAYEDFVQDPQAVLARIKHFAGVNAQAAAHTDYPVSERLNPSGNRITLEALRLLNRISGTRPGPTELTPTDDRLHRFRILAANRHSPLLEYLSRPWQAGLEGDIEDRSHGLFTESNRRLSEEFDVDTRALGYPV